jgi:beta-lactamase class A
MSNSVRPLPQESIQTIVEKSSKGFAGSSGIVVAGVDGARVEHRAEESFEAASVVKLPILVELARRAEAGELKLQEKMTFEERFRAEGSGVLKERQAGGSYSLEQLAEWMITESDNTATDMLLDRLGMSAIEQQMRKLGLEHTTVQRTIFDFDAFDRGLDNRISAADTATLLLRMLSSELPRSAWMLDILQRTKRKDLLQARLPKDVKVAHKTGQLQGVLHDAGIVYTEPPYVIVVLTQGADESAAAEFIRRLSADVYAAVEDQAAGDRVR